MLRSDVPRAVQIVMAEVPRFVRMNRQPATGATGLARTDKAGKPLAELLMADAVTLVSGR